jgi:hypothetical protein
MNWGHGLSGRAPAPASYILSSKPLLQKRKGKKKMEHKHSFAFTSIPTKMIETRYKRIWKNKK